MISPYWFALLWKPLTVAVTTLLVIALPYALWEFGQWRIGYATRRRLPFHCYGRVAAPVVLSMVVQLFFVLTFAALKTWAHARLATHEVPLVWTAVLLTVCVYPVCLTIVWRLLRMPFAMAGVGTLPQLHWSANAASMDCGNHV
jgi:hypothetical protein